MFRFVTHFTATPSPRLRFACSTLRASHPFSASATTSIAPASVPCNYTQCDAAKASPLACTNACSLCTTAAAVLCWLLLWLLPLPAGQVLTAAEGGRARLLASASRQRETGTKERAQKSTTVRLRQVCCRVSKWALPWQPPRRYAGRRGCRNSCCVSQPLAARAPLRSGQADATICKAASLKLQEVGKHGRKVRLCSRADGRPAGLLVVHFTARVWMGCWLGRMPPATCPPLRLKHETRSTPYLSKQLRCRAFIDAVPEVCRQAGKTGG